MQEDELPIGERPDSGTPVPKESSVALGKTAIFLESSGVRMRLSVTGITVGPDGKRQVDIGLKPTRGADPLSIRPVDAEPHEDRPAD